MEQEVSGAGRDSSVRQSIFPRAALLKTPLGERANKPAAAAHRQALFYFFFYPNGGGGGNPGRGSLTQELASALGPTGFPPPVGGEEEKLADPFGFRRSSGVPADSFDSSAVVPEVLPGPHLYQ